MKLNQFLALFPKIDPPLTITDESIFAFSKKNKLINLETANRIMSELETDYDEAEEREYIPCFQLHLSDEFYSLVYWRASALSYEYYLVNLDKKGQLLDRRLVAGIVAEDDSVVRMYLSIDVNQIFYIAAQLSDDGQELVDKNDTQTYSLEVLPDGSIITS